MSLMDARGSARCQHEPVPNDRPLRIVLDVDRGEPLAGWIEIEGSARRRFDGLVQLVSRLDEAQDARLKEPGSSPTDGEAG